MKDKNFTLPLTLDQWKGSRQIGLDVILSFHSPKQFQNDFVSGPAYPRVSVGIELRNLELIESICKIFHLLKNSSRAQSLCSACTFFMSVPILINISQKMSDAEQYPRYRQKFWILGLPIEKIPFFLKWNGVWTVIHRTRKLYACPLHTKKRKTRFVKTHSKFLLKFQDFMSGKSSYILFLSTPLTSNRQNPSKKLKMSLRWGQLSWSLQY